MASVLEYTTPQGTYTGAFEYDADADLFHGEVVNAGAVLTFQGRSIDELKAALKDTVDDYLDWCAERGKQPQKPFSGNLPLRIGSELHRDVAAAAMRADKSVNQFVKDVLGRAIVGDSGLDVAPKRRRDALVVRDRDNTMTRMRSTSVSELKAGREISPTSGGRILGAKSGRSLTQGKEGRGRSSKGGAPARKR